MLERIIADELRRADFASARVRLSRAAQLTEQEHLRAPDKARVLLLAAQLADATGDARQTDLFIGRILAAEWLLRGEARAATDRFSARLALNRGMVADARYLVDRIERTVTITPIGLGAQREEVIDERENEVSAATWLISAEVSLAEGAAKRALTDLDRARARFAYVPPAPDDAALFELLCALALILDGQTDGAENLAALYRIYVVDAGRLAAQTTSRIAAACGRLAQVNALNQLETERWSALGACCPADIENHLGAPLREALLPNSESEMLPETEQLLDLLETSFAPFGVAPDVHQATTDAAAVTSQQSNDLAPAASPTITASVQVELPLDVSLSHTRLDSITSMFDLDGDTGSLEIDWSECAPEILAEAIESGAVSPLIARAHRGVIYFNDGAYVDARFCSDEDELERLAPTEVIYELLRLALARIPRSRARQLVDDPHTPHTPERINRRPNHLNLELAARIDELRRPSVYSADPASESSARQIEASAFSFDADAATDFRFAFSPDTVAVARIEEHAEEARLSFIQPSPLFRSLAAIFAAMTLDDLCAALRNAVSQLGVSTESGVFVVATNHAESLTRDERFTQIAACGAPAATLTEWYERVAGPLVIRLGLQREALATSSSGDEQRQAVSTLLSAAAHRLLLIPGTTQHDAPEFESIIAADSQTQKLLRTVREFAPLDGTTARRKLQHIMITGERGVGKELIAQALHRWSGRAAQPFRAVNMSRINAELAPAEIFGASKGGYTGATADRRGLIQQFAGGTLFLDEIDEADDKVQAMLKRVVEYGTYERVGDPTELRAEVRFIVATNRIGEDASLVKEDLRDRFWEIGVPPLRDRRADIRPLAEHFARRHEYALPEPVLAWLESGAHLWPGNIRQLQNTVERACSLAHTAADLTLDLFHRCLTDARGAQTMPPTNQDDHLHPHETLEARLQKIEKAIIERALTEARGNKTQAAERLGGTRQWLYKRCRALGIKGAAEG